jgi:hypothetical protein
MINLTAICALTMATPYQTIANNPLFGLVEYGVLGFCVIALAIAYVRKDKQVNDLYLRLIEKSEQHASKYHELAESLDETLKELVDVIDTE